MGYWRELLRSGWEEKVEVRFWVYFLWLSATASMAAVLVALALGEG